MANVARINPEGIRRYMKGFASGGAILDVRQQPTFPILPPTQQPTIPALPVTQQPPATQVTAESQNPPPAVSADKQPHFTLVRLGFSNAGRIPGKVNPNVADDVTIDAKKGEYVLPVEVVGAMGGPDAIDAMVKNIKTKMGVPAEVGPKMRSEPDAQGRMNAKGMRGFAGGGMIGGFTGPYAEMLAQQAYADELARASELPNRGGVRVGQGSPVVSTAPAVPVGTPYPPNPNMLPVPRPVVATPGPNSRARGFSLGAEGATVSPARPTPTSAAPLQIEYTIDGGSRTVPSRGPRPVATAADIYQDARTMTGSGVRPFVNNKALGFISKLARSPVAKGLGVAGAASQIYTGAQKLMRGNYLEGGNDMLAGGGFFAGPVGKAYSAGNAVGTVLNSGINALGLGVDPNSGDDGSYTPEQQAVFERSADARRQPVKVAEPVRVPIPEIKPVEGFKQTQPIDPIHTSAQDDASRLAARNAQYAATAQDAAATDAREAFGANALKNERTARAAADTKERIAILNNVIAHAGRPEQVEAAKNELAVIVGQQTLGLKADEIAAGLEKENIKGGFGLKEQALRNEGAATTANITGGFHVAGAKAQHNLDPSQVALNTAHAELLQKQAEGTLSKEEQVKLAGMNEREKAKITAKGHILASTGIDDVAKQSALARIDTAPDEVLIPGTPEVPAKKGFLGFGSRERVAATPARNVKKPSLEEFKTAAAKIPANKGKDLDAYYKATYGG